MFQFLLPILQASKFCPKVQVIVSLYTLDPLLGLVLQHLLTGSGHITELEAGIVYSLQSHLTVLP